MHLAISQIPVLHGWEAFVRDQLCFPIAGGSFGSRAVGVSE